MEAQAVAVRQWVGISRLNPQESNATRGLGLAVHDMIVFTQRPTLKVTTGLVITK
jgi:hypothetical protein